MTLYVDSRGKGSNYPPFSGALFWVQMYRSEVMVDSQIYLCPSNYDDNNEGADLMKDPLPPNACSYGGRINTLGHNYRISSYRDADTPIGCDDDEGEPNHKEFVNVIFLDCSARDFLLTDPVIGQKRIGAGILTVCTN